MVFLLTLLYVKKKENCKKMYVKWQILFILRTGNVNFFFLLPKIMSDFVVPALKHE